MKKDNISVETGMLAFMIVAILIFWVVNLTTAWNGDETIETPSTIQSEPEVQKGQREKKDVFSFEDTRSHMNVSAFGSNYNVYRFEGSDIIVYQAFGNTYMVGEDSEGTSIVNCYASLMRLNSQFVALSNEQMLFLTSYGLMAVDFEEKEETRTDGKTYIVHESTMFDELSDEQKESFVYPITFETISNKYRDYNVPKEEVANRLPAVTLC